MNRRHRAIAFARTYQPCTEQLPDDDSGTTTGKAEGTRQLCARQLPNRDDPCPSIPTASVLRQLKQIGLAATQLANYISNLGISSLQRSSANRAIKSPADQPCTLIVLRVVLTSGYSHVLVEDSGYPFELLRKPYSVEDLLGVLSEASLD